MIRVGGLTYWEIKKKALNGGRSKLDAEQLGFVGFVSPPAAEPSSPTRHWLQPTNPSTIDKQLEELERLRDLAPGWIRLARELVKDDES
jgi:hypothetical protein